MIRRALFAATLLLPITGSIAQAVEKPSRELSKSESELVRICDEMYSAYDSWHSKAETIKDEGEREKYRSDNDPSAKYVAQLTEFEEAHRGTYAGLMALNRLMILGAGGGDINGPMDVGRRHALKILPVYVGFPELPNVIRHLDAGNSEPLCEVALRQLIGTPNCGDPCRAYARYLLAHWALTMFDTRETHERRLTEIAKGSPKFIPEEQEFRTRQLALTPSHAKLAELERESIEILESLAKSDSDVRPPAVTNVDEKWYLIRVAPENAEAMPSLQKLAEGRLFKHQHLRIGAPAPALKVELISGETWSLAEQRGKTVVIQFSFKGCGPCEAMYPDLQAMAEQYEQKLTILGIMADNDRQDTIDAVKSGKLTWNVHWDGERGPIVTQWSVTGFPTIYVVGPDGRIGAHNLRGEWLRSKIAELVQ